MMNLFEGNIRKKVHNFILLNRYYSSSYKNKVKSCLLNSLETSRFIIVDKCWIERVVLV